MTSHHDDMKHELRRTKSVSASLDTFLNTVRNRLRAGVEADGGRGDMISLRELLADLDDRDGIRSSIVHGTVAGDQARDVDPDAPPPASSPGSLGGNVYGSKGPEDTDTQRNTSSGAAGADMRGAEHAGDRRPADNDHSRTVNDPGHPMTYYSDPPRNPTVGDPTNRHPVVGSQDHDNDASGVKPNADRDRDEFDKWKAEQDAKKRETEHA